MWKVNIDNNNGNCDNDNKNSYNTNILLSKKKNINAKGLPFISQTTLFVALHSPMLMLSFFMYAHMKSRSRMFG